NTIIANNEIENEIYLSQITELLEKQEAVVKNNGEESAKRLESTKGLILMLKIISEAEINQLCQKQTEITKLAMQLEETAQQEERQITQMIINVSDINNEKGYVLIGNQIGNNNNFSYNKSMETPRTIYTKRQKRKNRK